MTYKLFATDMDGTLLNSSKEVSERNQQAINKALDQGKHVIFSTGRCLQELEQYFKLFPKMRYALCESGAVLYDIKEHKMLYHKAIPVEYVREIVDYARTKDIMIQFLMENQSVLSSRDMENLDHFYMEEYKDTFEEVVTIKEDAVSYCQERGWSADKICLYHPNTDDRQKTKEQMLKYPLTLAFSERTSLEISPEGVDKGIGLSRLCDHLGITMEETIAIGDGFNDLSLLKTAGLSVAVENANDEIKDICDIVVADCNHDGVAEAIENHFLVEEMNK